MKNQVIKFLGDLPKSGSEQFNQALDHFRKSKNHDPEKLRYYNALGFSQDRLESLLYELKKLHGVTDTEVAMSKVPLTPKGGIEKVVKKIFTPEELEALENNIVAFNLETSSEEEIQALTEGIILFVKSTGEVASSFYDIPNKELIQAVKNDIIRNREIRANALQLDDAQKVKKDAPASEEKSEDNNEEAPASEKSEVPSVDKKDDAPAADISTALDVTKEETSAENKMNSEEIEAQIKGAALEKEKFLKEDLANFDLESEKYNSIKSFAAILSDYLNEDPADQKSDTLKAFVAEAKKKFAQA